jgi:glucosamine-phosphate N-acetyltransferase
MMPEGFSLRPLKRSDFIIGHLDVLRDLAYVGDITEQEWTERFDLMAKCVGTYYVLVIVQNTGEGEKIAGTGTLMVEKKLYVP